MPGLRYDPLPVTLFAAFAALTVACSPSGDSPSQTPTADGAAPDAGASSGSSGAGSGSGSGGSGPGSGGAGFSGSIPSSSGSSGSGSVQDAGTAVPDGGSSRSAGGPWVCPPGPFGNPIPPGAAPTRVANLPPKDALNMDGYGFTTIDGPVWVNDTLFVSEFPGNPYPPPSRILGVTTSGVVNAVGPDGGVDTGTNGMAVDPAGNLFGAIHKDGSISRVDTTTGTRTPVASTYGGVRFNSPNDLAIRSDGTIYFSDPSYQAPMPPPQPMTRVYRVAPGTHAVTVVDATLTQPNGVTLSLDENTLYVSSNGGVYAFPVIADGSTGPRAPTPFTSMNIDGMGIDCAGNLYGAAINTPNVVVFSPNGSMLGSVTVPSVPAILGVTNVAFGGADHQTLFISAQGSSGGQGLFEVHMNVPGEPY